ncbi:MAG: conjugal transfer protein TraX [Defluviitaleaceae bacterium]|nr:conjugal transfer protein TraX [Defluviitaleaceae bacterium]
MLDAYKLKWIAIVAMFCAHMVIAWWEIIPAWLRYPMYGVGGAAFPVLAYFVVEGYRHTSSLRRYLLRLLVFGVLAAPFHIVATSIPIGGGHPLAYPWLNIMFAIMTGLVVLVLYDRIKSRLVFWLLYILVIVPVALLLLEWYVMGVTTVLLFHIIKPEGLRRVLVPVVAGAGWLMASFAHTLVPYEILAGDYGPLIVNPDFIRMMPTFAVGCVVAAFLLRRYNGQRGRGNKWLFYVIYPLHFMVLAAVALVFGLVELNFF